MQLKLKQEALLRLKTLRGHLDGVQRMVPAGAATGKISVTTPDGTATSVTNFSVLP